MKSTSALILEPSDFTKDGNLKKEAFDAFTKADLVVRDGVVIKTGAALVARTLSDTAPKRIRRKATPAAEAPAPAPTTTADGHA